MRSRLTTLFHLIATFISRWRDTIWVETRHIVPHPRRIIPIITTMRRINQITERLVQVMVPVTVNNSLASLCLITTLSAILNTLRITLTNDIGLVAIAMTGVAAVCRARWVVVESVAEASWV
jgi:hypothetical protein